MYKWYIVFIHIEFDFDQIEIILMIMFIRYIHIEIFFVIEDVFRIIDISSKNFIIIIH